MPHDSTGLSEASRIYLRWNRWFLFFVLTMPLGVIAPCVVSAVTYRIWGDYVSAPIAFSAFFWPLVGLAGTLLIRGSRAKAKRSLELARLAETLKLQFCRKPPLEKYEFLKNVRFMADPHAQSGANLMEGNAGPWALQSLDYEYTYHWGSVSEVGAQTIAILSLGFERLPDFGVFPISILGRLEDTFLGRGERISFPQAPLFDQYFAVVGDNAPAIVSYFSQPLVELLLANRTLSIIVENGRVMVFRRLTYVRAADYQEFLAQAYRVAELLAVMSNQR